MVEKNTDSVNVKIDFSIGEAFSTQLEKRGQLKYKATEAAIKIWLSLPTEIQGRVIESDVSEIQEIFEGLSVRLREDLHKVLTHEILKKKRRKADDTKGRRS